MAVCTAYLEVSVSLVEVRDLRLELFGSQRQTRKPDRPIAKSETEKNQLHEEERVGIWRETRGEGDRKGGEGGI